MSSQEAARLYETVIADVVAELRTDFENQGIDEATLQELANLWKAKLLEAGVGVFPWDPEGTVPVKREVPVRVPEVRVKKEKKVKAEHDPTLEGLSDVSLDEGFHDSDDLNEGLDDSDDLDDALEDGDVETNTMLCLYDKVQRIKNKWKLALKEGVANINGTDYAFFKATGETEWL